MLEVRDYFDPCRRFRVRYIWNVLGLEESPNVRRRSLTKLKMSDYMTSPRIGLPVLHGLPGIPAPKLINSLAMAGLDFMPFKDRHLKCCSKTGYIKYEAEIDWRDGISNMGRCEHGNNGDAIRDDS